MPRHRHDVFLSYAREDTNHMNWVRQQIVRSSLSVWTDEGIAPGIPLWDEAIEDALENSGCMVVILTPNAKKAKGVRDEIHYAGIHKVPIFPLLAQGDEAASIPYVLSGAQRVDIRNKASAAQELRRLIDAIYKLLDIYKEDITESLIESFLINPSRHYDSQSTGLFDEANFENSHVSQFPQDELFPQVVEYVRRVDKVSRSLLQRRFHIGFTRADRLIKDMERWSIIAPAKDGNGTHEIIHFDSAPKYHDELYDEAVVLVRSLNKVSISMLQRHFHIGSGRASKLIEMMEKRAVIGPPEDGNKSRKVVL